MGGSRAVAALLRLWERLVEPHGRITAPEDRHGARLFSILMLVHILANLGVLAVANYVYVVAAGRTIWGDQDTWVVAGGSALIAATYLVLRSGRYRLAVALYIAVAAVIPLLAPFVSDPNAEIGTLATALIPPLLASYVYRSRWVAVVLAVVVGFACIRLVTAPLPPRGVGTGFMILISVVVAGALTIVSRHRFMALERARAASMRESEAALAESTERLRVLLGHSLDVLVGTDRHGFVTFIGGAFEATTGYTVEERLGHSIFDHILPGDVARVRTEFETLLVERARELRTEWRQAHRDGRILWIEALAANRLGHPGLDNVLFSLRDVSARRQAEEDLRQSEEKYRNLFETVSDGIYIVDPQGQVLEVNEAACRQLGYDRKELVGMRVADFSPEYGEPSIARADRAIRQEGGTFQSQHRRRDGTSFPVELVVSKIVFLGARAFLAVARDLEARERARAPEPGGSETILYAEDDRALRESTARHLERLGYRVLAAGSGPEALALASRHPERIDLVFTDTDMPGMNGPEMAGKLRYLRPDTPALFTSGHPEAFQDGKVDFLPKPYGPTDLAVRIRRALDSGKA